MSNRTIYLNKNILALFAAQTSKHEPNVLVGFSNRHNNQYTDHQYIIGTNKLMASVAIAKQPQWPEISGMELSGQTYKMYMELYGLSQKIEHVDGDVVSFDLPESAPVDFLEIPTIGRVNVSLADGACLPHFPTMHREFSGLEPDYRFTKLVPLENLYKGHLQMVAKIEKMFGIKMERSTFGLSGRKKLAKWEHESDAVSCHLYFRPRLK